MKDGMTLWRTRVNAYWNEAIRYLRLIGNSGFLFTVYVLIIIGSYYYSLLLDWLPPTFPALWIFVFVFGHFLTRSGVRTFVKQGDVVFLLPYESKLGDYFRASKWYSIVLQSGILVLVLVVLSPFFNQYLTEAGPILYVLLMIIISKVWNVFASWEEQRFQHPAERQSHFLLRAFINLVFTFLLFSGAHILLILSIFLLKVLLFIFYYSKIAKKFTLKWEHLLDVERGMLLFFYRIANAFTDVPQLRNKVRERRYLNWFLQSTKPSPTVYHYLFARTFIRANDYAGIYLRLTLISAVILIALPSGWLQLAVFLLFMHMIVGQLSTIWYHYDTHGLIDIYPVDQQVKIDALTQLSFRLLLITMALQFGVLLVTSTWIIAALTLIIGVFYSYVGSHTLIHKRRK